MNTYKIESIDTNKDVIRHKFNVNNLYEDGTYLHKVFIRFTLPAIYSSHERQFRWIKYLGYNILEKVVCNIKFKNSDSTQIKLYTYTEWLFIWYEISLSNEEKQNHYKLIGHIPELYDPQNSSDNKGIYPVSNLIKQQNRWLINNNNTQKAYSVNIENDDNFNRPPSISNTTLFIPLNFYFSNSVKDSLPLHLIEFIEFEFKLRDINNLYTVLLSVDDFIVDIENDNSNITANNYNTNIKLPSNINFIDNQGFAFSSNVHYSESDPSQLSMFDVLINEYRIVPLLTGLSAINNFILDSSLNPVNNNSLYIYNTITKNTFYGQLFCNMNIILNIINSKKYIDNKIIIKGLLSDINEQVLNFNINFDSNITKVGTFNDANILLDVYNHNNNLDIFFLLRHNERKKKNDLLNFTNLNFNNSIPWKPVSSNIVSNNIEITGGTHWQKTLQSKSIKIGIDDNGVFSIKKHILDGNIFKFVNILEYKSSDLNISNTNVSQYDINSSKFYNEKIITETKLSIKTDNQDFNYTTSKEPYDFYNKITILNKYKNTVPGLYHINNPYNNIKQLILNQSSLNQISLNNSNSYNYIIYCNSYKVISL